MKKLILSAAFLLATLAGGQAIACDMGAIETWVAGACQGNGCETNSSTEKPAAGCDGSNCTKLHSVVRPEPGRTANDSLSSL